jgi:hypothetical protein
LYVLLIWIAGAGAIPDNKTTNNKIAPTANMFGFFPQGLPTTCFSYLDILFGKKAGIRIRVKRKTLN